MNSTIRKNAVIFIKGWGFSLAIALLVATSIKSSLADWNDVPTGSMQPTILIGDRVFVNKLAYDLKIPYTTLHISQWGDPGRGDIVVFYSPKDGTRLIKRVVGLPGDTIALWNNHLFVNGKAARYNLMDAEISEQMDLDLAPPGDSILLTEASPQSEHLIMLYPGFSSMKTFGPVTVPKDHYFMMGDNRDNSADSRYFGFVERHQIVGRATRVALSREGNFLHPRWSRFFKELI